MSEQTQTKDPADLDDLTIFLADQRRVFGHAIRSALRYGMEAGIRIGKALAAGADPNSVQALTAKFIEGNVPLLDPEAEAADISAACQILAASLSGRRTHERYWFRRRELYYQLIRMGVWDQGPKNCLLWIRELWSYGVMPFLKEQRRNYRGYLYYPCKDPHFRKHVILPSNETTDGKQVSKKIPA